MSRWWRAYDDALNNPKLQKLPPALFKAWFNLCCIASKHDGALPNVQDLAFALRFSEQKTNEVLKKLEAAGLLDRDGEALKPHDWDHHQYKSDSSAERTRRYRKRQRDGESDVTVTVQNRTESDTEQNRTEDRAADAAARAKAKRACSFPENFFLTDERRAVADRHGIPVDRVAGVFEHFRDHSIANGKTFKDWDAAWRTWCRNDEKFGGNNGPRNNGNGSRTTGGRTGADAVITAFGKVADRRAGRSDGGREDNEIPPGRHELDLTGTSRP
jgi:hypothetical protein